MSVIGLADSVQRMQIRRKTKTRKQWSLQIHTNANTDSHGTHAEGSVSYMSLLIVCLACLTTAAARRPRTGRSVLGFEVGLPDEGLGVHKLVLGDERDGVPMEHVQDNLVAHLAKRRCARKRIDRFG